MNKFFDDTMQGLLEAVEIEKGNATLTRKTEMPAPTFVSDSDEELNQQIEKMRERILQAEHQRINGAKTISVAEAREKLKERVGKRRELR